jgi:hypothetical protein
MLIQNLPPAASHPRSLRYSRIVVWYGRLAGQLHGNAVIPSCRTNDCLQQRLQHPARWGWLATDCVNRCVGIPGGNVQELRLLHSEFGLDRHGKLAPVCLDHRSPLESAQTSCLRRIHATAARFFALPLSVARFLWYAYLRQLARAKERSVRCSSFVFAEPDVPQMYLCTASACVGSR